jgi:hypothetical protein
MSRRRAAASDDLDPRAGGAPAVKEPSAPPDRGLSLPEAVAEYGGFASPRKSREYRALRRTIEVYKKTLPERLATLDEEKTIAHFEEEEGAQKTLIRKLAAGEIYGVLTDEDGHKKTIHHTAWPKLHRAERILWEYSEIRTRDGSTGTVAVFPAAPEQSAEPPRSAPQEPPMIQKLLELIDGEQYFDQVSAAYAAVCKAMVHDGMRHAVRTDSNFRMQLKAYSENNLGGVAPKRALVILCNKK